MDALRYYDFTLAANGVQMLTVSGKNFRIQSQTGAVDVTVDSVGTLPGLLTGQGLKNVPFSRLTLRDASGAPNVGQILVAPEEFIDNRTYGVSTIAGGSVDLAAATLNTITRPLLAGASWSNAATLGAGATNIFLPAANVNGAIIHSAYSQDISAGAVLQSFLAKNAAPASVLDGEVVALSQYAPVTGNSVQNIAMTQPLRIAAGLGLYFYSSAAGSAGYGRACRYTLL